MIACIGCTIWTGICIIIAIAIAVLTYIMKGIGRIFNYEKDNIEESIIDHYDNSYSCGNIDGRSERTDSVE